MSPPYPALKTISARWLVLAWFLSAALHCPAQTNFASTSSRLLGGPLRLSTAFSNAMLNAQAELANQVVPPTTVGPGGALGMAGLVEPLDNLPGCTLPPAGLVGWWQGEGNACDVLGQHNGTLHGGVAFVTGEVGYGFSFNGSSGHVGADDSGSLELTSALTIECWVRRRNLANEDYLINKGGDYTWGALNYGVTINSSLWGSALTFTFANGYRRSVSIADYNWHHVAVVAINGQTDPSFYVDGVAQPVTGRGGAGTINLYLSHKPLQIGAQVDPDSGWNYYSSAALDEVSLYNTALTGPQIQAIYQAGVAGKCPPAPTIVTQPMSQTAYWGDSVTFSVQASGSPPLSYQWRFTPLGGTPVNISGATDSSLTINNVDDTVGGSYSVEVFNSAASTVSANAVLTTPSSGESALPLVGARQEYRFKSDTTYYVDGSAGPVELYGTTVIEGGAVIKFANNANAKLVVNGPLECQTSPWRPAIFTAQDDDTVGWPLSFSTGAPTGRYAAVALEIASFEDIVFKHLRVAYAQTAVHYPPSAGRQVLATVRHAQIVHCGAGIVSEGTASEPCVLSVANVLLADVGQAISGSHFRGSAAHLTVDGCTTFALDSSSSNLGFFVTNSVFGAVASLGSGVGLDGSNNGFYQGHSPQFGAGQVTDDQTPFAPTGGVDEQNNPVIYIVNGQGAYYLRDGSPFEVVGTSNVDPSLKADFGQMTTVVPPNLFGDDVNSSMTLGPKALRDAQAANLGYHYPVVDYVLMLATVNNATLNIDQGTVLALVGDPYWWGNWGLRLNPGGRLNVNGVPTNRVVFAHLEAVQESPVGILQPWGPMITWRELYFQSGPPTPYPEAKVQYADFPTLSGGWNGHFAPIDDYLGCSYSIITNLQLEGCHLQGGWFVYDDGGPPGRALKLRNTVFERCQVWLYDAGAYELYFDAPGCSAQVTAANNLFYHSSMRLAPVAGTGAGATWTFTDNLFDNASFCTPDFYNSFYNGPVGVNNHNAYVGMSSVPNGGGRLSPAAPTTTDPDLPSLAYDTGALGRFYLPATAIKLLGKGSRSAGAAGQYHFTCVTSNQKEAGNQVSIGPHYLALLSGAVPDSNADGVPDWLADRNGNGTEDLNEMPWYSPSSSLLAILFPVSNSVVSGVIHMAAALGSNAAALDSVCPLVDGRLSLGSAAVKSPAASTAHLEIDTRYLEDGQHVFSLAYTPLGADGSRQTLYSPPVTLTTCNQTRQPLLERTVGRVLTLRLKVPSSVTDYTVWFFNSGYPKASDPFSPSIQTSYAQGSPANGVISYSETPANLGFGDGTRDPAIYSFTELANSSGGGQGSAVVNAYNRQFTPWPAAVETGWWAATYGDDPVDWGFGGRRADLYSYNLNPLTLAWNDLWWHGVWLNSGWRLCGTLSSSGSQATIAFPPGASGTSAQTWPLRLWRFSDEGPQSQDPLLLLGILENPNVRNFYGLGHGHPADFLNMDAGVYSLKIRHRYRFAFLDGCTSGLGRELLSAFGATDEEMSTPMYPPSDVPTPATIDINYYYNAGFRPAAFLGWKSTPVVGWYDAAEGKTRDDVTGEMCFEACYPALCNWHGQFLASWVFGRTLLQAIDDANTLAFSASSSPAPRADQFTQVQIPQPDGTTVTATFKPETCLRVYGYGNIKFNEYNHAVEWPQ